MKSVDPKAWLAELATVFERERERLGLLDADVGDGDHGASMARGFARAYEAVAADTRPAGPVLTAAGRAFMKGVGGASGPLFATLFLELGKSAGERGSLNLAAIGEGARRAVDRIQRLGRSRVGEKTMLDALAPAVDALEAAIGKEAALAAAAAAAAQAAAEGAEATRSMTARQGRARFIEGQGLGRVDPGATSMALVFGALSHVAERRCM